ncbi:MAG: N-acetyltransferase [Alphaproteobacteria bacterium]|nr:MAG: N-acetyltransferase [Alphaproteobacteria bacterium]
MKLPFDHIETPRLVLRPPEAGDWDVYFAFARDPRAQFIGGGPNTTRHDAWRAFGHMVGHWVLRDFGPFVMVLKDNGAPIGATGPWYPAEHPEHELSWIIWDGRFEGSGLAFEAAWAAREHAYAVLGWKTAVSYIDAGNTRSIRLAERLGCALDPDAPKPDDEEPPVLVYRHPSRAALADGGMEAYA